MEETVKPNLSSFILYILLIVIIIIGAVYLFFSQKNTKDSVDDQGITVSSETKKKEYQNPPVLNINQEKKYFADISTNKGKLRIELFAKDTPNTVNNFVFLAKDGFYDGTVFHRIMKNFMIQGGDPRGDGTGGPGYKFADEKIIRDYKRGIVAMANSGPNTNGSQFFIMHKDNITLPKNYIIFGLVTDGMDIVDKIAEIPVVDNGYGEESKPTEKVIIEKIDINEK